MDVVKTEPLFYPRISSGKPVYCPSGGRHKGGVNIILAFVWNVGPSRFDVKGRMQVEDLLGYKYQCGAPGQITS